MGFQTADTLALARELPTINGVTAVWVLRGADDRSAVMYVTVRGFDDEAFAGRLQVRRQIEDFIATHREDMRFSGFDFDYHVFIDDPALGPPQIPAGAFSVYEESAIAAG